MIFQWKKDTEQSQESKKPEEMTALDHLKERREEYAKQRQKVNDWCPIGGEFKYFGKTMIVVSHYKSDKNNYWDFPYLSLTARYLDDNGQFHEINFGYEETMKIIGI